MKDILVIINRYNHLIFEKFFEKYNVEYHIYDKPNENHQLINGSIDYNSYQTILVIIDDMTFDNIAKTSQYDNSTKHNEYSYLDNNEAIFYENINKFNNIFPSHTKFILVDSNNESIQKTVLDYTKKWLDISSNHYSISSRLYSLNHNRLLTNQIYLTLLRCFHRYKFNQFDKLYYSYPTNPKYDFVTYLGHTHKVENYKKRMPILKYILDNDFSKLKYQEPSHIIINDTNYNDGGLGHMWNLLNSLSAKIQIIFENSQPTHPLSDSYFLTEKTLKCFYYPHPYILLLHSTVIDELRKWGFMFSYDGGVENTYYRYLLHDIKKDIDGWIEKNMNDFYHNQNRLFEIVNSTELPIHTFLEQIINN